MVTKTRFRCTTGRRDSAIQRITQPRHAAIAPTTKAQAIVAMEGSTGGGTEVRASEKVPRPLQLSRPMKTTAPMPDASKPGSAIKLRVAPPMPATSMIRKAPRMGEPRRVLTAAKLPAEAMIVSAIGGESFFTKRTVRAARPPPIAMRGASGPRTPPRLSVASAARKIPGNSRSTGVLPVLNPKAGRVAAIAGKVADRRADQEST